LVLSSWLIDRLEEMKDEQILLVQDPLRLLPETDGAVHRFANENGFTVIIASTNLVFRELYEKATAAKDTNKLLVIDRAPVRRRTHASMTKAPLRSTPIFWQERRRRHESSSVSGNF